MVSWTFETASWVDFETALASNWILTQWTHFWGFSLSHNFLEKISKESRSDWKVPDESSIWRECYSFSERENRAFAITLSEARNLAQSIGVEISVQTDAIWNLYIKVKWKSEEMHMVWSHLDSVENGGKYDGPAWIASGLQILQQVLHHKKQWTLQNSFCLTVFRSEESWPHNGMACLGSSVATGTVSREKLDSIVYKTENGSPVLLKDHLESSLRKYFQAVERNERWKRWEMLWWEGDEYIDYEWWYFFCEQHDLSEEDYSNGTWWEKICEPLESPKITKENTASYHELHIEQGTIIENITVDGKQAQLWIVSGGIGWAQRYKTLETVSVESEELSVNDYEVYSFEILWFSDHTGSTPNNSDLESSQYRRDAQIATSLFLQAFLEKWYWSLISSKSQNDEGYTKVPYKQQVKLTIAKDKKSEFTNFVRQIRRLLREENAIEFNEWRYYCVKDNISVIETISAKKTISSLLGVSEVASREFKRQREENLQEKQFGTTRATLTNVHLTPEGLDFNLDIREVDSDDVKILIDGVSSELQNIIPDWIKGLQQVSAKTHQKISREMRDRQKKVAEILWYTAIYLPSVPWHDGDRLAAVWIPISMTFVRQRDGISHNPAEQMRKKDYNIACHNSMITVLANLV